MLLAPSLDPPLRTPKKYADAMQTLTKNYLCFFGGGLPKTARYRTALVAVVVPCGESRMAKKSQSRMAHHFRLVVQVPAGGGAEKISALCTHLIIEIPMTTHKLCYSINVLKDNVRELDVASQCF